MNLEFQPLEGREYLVAPTVAEFVQKQGLSQTVKVARINNPDLPMVSYSVRNTTFPTNGSQLPSR